MPLVGNNCCIIGDGKQKSKRCLHINNPGPSVAVIGFNYDIKTFFYLSARSWRCEVTVLWLTQEGTAKLPMPSPNRTLALDDAIRRRRRRQNLYWFRFSPPPSVMLSHRLQPSAQSFHFYRTPVPFLSIFASDVCLKEEVNYRSGLIEWAPRGRGRGMKSSNETYISYPRPADAIEPGVSAQRVFVLLCGFDRSLK